MDVGDLFTLPSDDGFKRFFQGEMAKKERPGTVSTLKHIFSGPPVSFSAFPPVIYDRLLIHEDILAQIIERGFLVFPTRNQLDGGLGKPVGMRVGEVFVTFPLSSQSFLHTIVGGRDIPCFIHLSMELSQ